MHHVKQDKYLSLVHGIGKISVTIYWSLMCYFFLQRFRVNSTLQREKRNASWDIYRPQGYKKQHGGKLKVVESRYIEKGKESLTEQQQQVYTRESPS